MIYTKNISILHTAAKP